MAHQRTFVNYIAKKLNITKQEDWYKLKFKDYVKVGGTGLLTKYHYSPSKLLATVLSEYLHCWTNLLARYTWDVTKFKKVPNRYWSQLKNQRAFMDSLAKKLSILNTRSTTFC